MEKIKVKIIDTNFAHAKYSSDFQESKYIEWDRNSLNHEGPLFMTDNSMYSLGHAYHPNKIGMLMEPRAMNPAIYDWIKANRYDFNRILTYDKELLAIGKPFERFYHGMCWIYEKDMKVYEKTKLMSIIASAKTQLYGHNLRHQTILMFKNYFDVYGRGYKQVDYKLDALKDYAYSVVIENSKQDYYFTEKLLDCFVTGTVPIYWGCPSIGDFFNTDGMIIFNTLEDLQSQINSLTLDKYNSMLPAINENFERAKSFTLAEDWIFENTDIFKEYKK